MAPIGTGSMAPPIPGVDLRDGPRAVWFYKVTCPVCQMAAPVAERLHAAFPQTVVGVGQDPVPQLEAFGSQYGVSFPTVPDLAPYDVSEDYGIRVVPTLVVVTEGRVSDVVESWDRDGYNRASSSLGVLTGREALGVSDEDDGLPFFRPG
jgi:thiol-disulfide isomerase/thioredoxin